MIGPQSYIYNSKIQKGQKMYYFVWRQYFFSGKPDFILH